MPELPEVETMCRGIAEVVGSRITGVSRTRCRLKPITVEPAAPALSRRCRGCRIERILRVGKRAVLLLESGDRLVFEPRMTGLVLLADPPDQAHLRLRLRLTGDVYSDLWYWDRRGLGSVRLLDTAEFDAAYGPSRLGPNPLDVGLAAFRARFAGCRRAIKVALLDQKLLAGIGNLYAAEILHVARIAPDRVASSLDDAEWRRLHRGMQMVLEEAIRYEGSTLADGTYRNALNQNGGYQNQHRVYARQGQSCPRCGSRGTVERIVQAQRATFFCPRCQR